MTTTDDLGYRLLRDVGRLNRWASHRSSLEIPPAQLRLLALIDELAPTRVGEIAAADHCSQPTITSQLNRTEVAGWTTRSPDPDDARAQMVTVTPAGRHMLDTARRARAATLAPALAGWSDDQRRRLTDAVAVLDELLDTLDERNSA